MNYKTKIRKWGNSQGICIPKPILDTLGIKVGDSIDVNFIDSRIVITKSKRALKQYTIEQLFKDFNPNQ